MHFILIIIGIINMYLAIKVLVSPDFARNYISKHPEAWIWRKIFGLDRAVKLSRYFFAPFGVIIGLVFIYFGVTIYLDF